MSEEGGPRLIIASRSPRRRDLLLRMGLDPEVRPADIDETLLEGEGAAEHVERLAREKALAVARLEDDALVIGGDTVVVLDGRILGKPESATEAVSMLLDLANRTHHVLSGVAVAVAGPGEGPAVVSAVQRTEVRFRPCDADTARAYVATGEPLDKAGAYGIQGRGAVLVASIDGDYDNVVGLPVGRLIELFGRLGWRYTFEGLRRA